MKNLTSSILSIVLFIFPVFQLLQLPHVTHAHSMEDDLDHDHNDMGVYDCEGYSTYSLSYLVDLQIKTTESTMTVIMNTTHTAYLGLGLSSDGTMVGHNAVIGNPDFVMKYQLDGKSPNFILPMSSSQQTLTNTKFEQGNDDGIYGSRLTFTKPLMDGENDDDVESVPTSGTINLIWSLGYDNFLTGHSQYGSIEVKIAPCMVYNTLTQVEVGKKALKAHGIVAAIVFGILMPMAIFASTFRDYFKRNWFQIHALLMMISTVLVIVLFSLSYKAKNDLKDDHFGQTHEVVGLIIMIVIFIQVLAAIFRPHPPKLVEDPASIDPTSIPPNTTTTGGETKTYDEFIEEEKTRFQQIESTEQEQEPMSLRKIWQIAHKSFGLIILLVGAIQMKSGLNLYSDMYDMNEALNTIYYIWVGIILLLLVISGYKKLK